MKVVIDIDEETYNYIKNKDDIESNILISDIVKTRERVVDTLIQSVVSGTLLPKTHGRLIDADAVKERMIPLSFSVQNWISEVNLDTYIPTIIKAESEDNE